MDFNKETEKGIVLVDFFAKWCGPCKMLAPNIDEVALKMGDKLHVIRIDVDEEEALANKFKIESIPTLFLFKDGKLLDTRLGYMNKDILEQWILEKTEE